jgi:hypothetical protein
MSELVGIESFEIIEKEKKGVVDGPERKIRCVACDRLLLNVKIIMPDAPSSWNVIAHCPCGDQSESYLIKGKFVDELGVGLIKRDIQANVDKSSLSYYLGEI